MNKRNVWLAIWLVLFLVFVGLIAKSLISPKPLFAPTKRTIALHFPTPAPTIISPKTTVVVAVGDVMLGRMVNVQMLKNKDFKYPFLKTADILSQANITFGNLESPLIENCPTTQTGMVFCGRAQAVEGLKFAGFDVMSVMNNHNLNQGQAGKAETISLLTKNNILASDNNLTIQQFNNETIGFLSFDLTLNNTFGPVLNKVKENISKVDLLIVSLHWGTEYTKQPAPWQKDLARQIIDAGAKVIIGHHPHVTQPTESYHNGLIFYSLGNFVFDQPWSEETKKGKIAKIIFEGKEIKSYEEIPVYITDYCQPQVAN